LLRKVELTIKHILAHVKTQTEFLHFSEVTQGLKQEDGLAPLLFNLELEHVIRQLCIDTRGTLQV
jgi:hypothetical protein